MKQNIFCMDCKAWTGKEDLFSCSLRCRQAYLTTNNYMLIPFRMICPFPKTEKELKYFHDINESEKYLFRTGNRPCPLCEGVGCKECDNKGDIQSYRDTGQKYTKIYSLAEEIRKFKNAFFAIVSGWENIENLFSQLEISLLAIGNEIENKEK